MKYFERMAENARQQLEHLDSLRGNEEIDIGVLVIQRMNAERAIWIFETVNTFTKEEVEFLRSLRTPAFTAEKGKAKAIKVKYGFSWNEIENIILHI